MTTTETSAPIPTAPIPTRPARASARRRQPRWTLAHATDLLTQWRASGLSMERFAAQHKLNPKRLSYWNGRVQQATTTPIATTPPFVPIVSTQPSSPHVATPPATPVIEISVRGLTLRLRESMDPSQLLSLLTTLTQLR